MANFPNSTTLATPADRQSDSGATGSNVSERRLAKPAGAGRHQNTHTLETSGRRVRGRNYYWERKILM